MCCSNDFGDKLLFSSRTWVVKYNPDLQLSSLKANLNSQKYHSKVSESHLLIPYKYSVTLTRTQWASMQRANTNDERVSKQTDKRLSLLI